MTKTYTTLFCTLIILFMGTLLHAQHSVARQWNEKILHAISTDLARPVVHARNLFHTSIAMYDAWAVYNPNAETYLLGKTVHGYYAPYRPVPQPSNIKAAQEETLSFAVYRIMKHRFANSPGIQALNYEIDGLMTQLGYNTDITSTNYKCGPAELGNYIAKCIIDYGLQDGANETNGYANQYYAPVNLPLRPNLPGDPSITDLNRWQPLQFTQFVDQSGNPFGDVTPSFLGAEWGNVMPFSLQPADAVVKERDGHFYKVYHDPGPPALLDTAQITANSEEYKWNHELVAIWASLLDPTDGVMIDISPASSGNNSSYPANLAEMHSFYNVFEGGDTGTGRSLNPVTGQPYTPQVVRRGDYSRVLAEFWADGPNSVTPPGHWFDILNYVNDQPGLEKRIRGTGPLCDNLEWDVKCYLAMGGAMHDAAIAAWGVKGWYDSSRPVSAIRGMAELGQSSDPNQPRYHPGGLRLLPGYIELIKAGDPLQGATGEFINQIKLYTWKGPGYIASPQNDVAGVGWIRAANWWPYQRPTFVTPPFAGYVSGHSTYSRAAAELLTALTGNAFFPGGMGEFHCKQYEYLVFEDGPSQDITLQWATYRDASDECSLSRIYGGIHPPMDDIPGRLIGMEIGPKALEYAEQYFTRTTPPDTTIAASHLFPNPTTCVSQLEVEYNGPMAVRVFQADGRLTHTVQLTLSDHTAMLDLSSLTPGVYLVMGFDNAGNRILQEKVLKL